MIDAFWQLVINQNVTLIVMLTNVVEEKAGIEISKAHKYWPEIEDFLLVLNSGIMVRTDEEERRSDDLYYRKFALSTGGKI